MHKYGYGPAHPPQYYFLRPAICSRKLLLATVLVLASVSVFVPLSTARAVLVAELPASVVTGEALLATVLAPHEGQVNFVWLDKNIQVPTFFGPRGHYAQALLPVPLDEKRKSLVLTIGMRTLPEQRYELQVLDKKRPVQKLDVQPGYVQPPPEVQARIARETKRTRALLGNISPQRYWNLPFKRPVPGSISSEFGLRRVFNGQPRSPHKGLDLRGAEGTPVLALSDGVVVLAEELYFSGNVVYLDHGLGVHSIYAHLSAIEVRPGERVQGGQQLGKVGSTGRVTGPHLHLGCYALGMAVDPVPLLENTP